MDWISNPGLLNPVAGYGRIANEVAALAMEEMRASRLPGQFGGPADAYRHLVGVAELTRRLGVLPAWAISEANELRSERAAFDANRRGATVPAANSPEAVRMDRHNNTIAIGGGEQALTFEDVVTWARAQIDRAGTDGSGLGGRPTWLPQERWQDNPSDINWPLDWSKVTRRGHIDAYPHGGERHRYGGHDMIDAPGGPVWVQPHMREGHPIHGYSRSRPTR
jgi:hypothetical protein